jgi:hypothetical protein
MRPPKINIRKKILNKRKFRPLICVEPVAKKNLFPRFGAVASENNAMGGKE